MSFLGMFKQENIPLSNPVHHGHFDYSQLSIILSGIRDGVMIVDVNSAIVVVNMAAQKLLGLTNEPKGIIFNQLLKLYKNNADITDSIWTGNFSDDNLKVVLQNAATQKEIYISLSVAQVVDGVSIWVLTMRDVSVERQLEEMKMGFVSIAAHELRTPLTSIKGYLSVFMGDYKNALNEDQKDLLNHIASSTERLLALVENLLNVSRVERGVVEFNPQGIDWVETITQIVDEFKTRAVEKNIQLNFIQSSSALPKVKADKVRISEVLSNLLSNAIIYTDANGKIDVSAEQQGNEVITHVVDTGRGIPKEAIEHLFTKFYRVSAGGLTTDAQGNGLGLYISKAIVDMHHGKIWVTSEVGKGSVFSFSLPTV